ncbi:MAG: hypothetical protein EBR82_22630 [Caulobacteraceae bacterium]|nr:hypothetical protein [Caulobacteraceae bacterium]
MRDAARDATNGAARAAAKAGRDFAEADRKGISHPRRMPAGTSVYVSRIKDDGMCTIRVCGSLMTQQVHMFTTVVPC